MKNVNIMYRKMREGKKNWIAFVQSTYASCLLLLLFKR